jgi:hypothetical protein
MAHQSWGTGATPGTNSTNSYLGQGTKHTAQLHQHNRRPLGWQVL